MKLSFWDVLSVLFLLGIVLMILVFGAILGNPASAFNPFPPPTAIPTLFIPTSTATLRVLPGYSSPTAEPSQTPRELRPSSTPIPTRTAFALPTFTPTPTATNTPTNTPTPSRTPTETSTPTRTPSPSATNPPPTVDTIGTATAQSLTETAAAYPQP